MRFRDLSGKGRENLGIDLTKCGRKSRDKTLWDTKKTMILTCLSSCAVMVKISRRQREGLLGPIPILKGLSHLKADFYYVQGDVEFSACAGEEYVAAPIIT